MVIVRETSYILRPITLHR